MRVFEILKKCKNPIFFVYTYTAHLEKTSFIFKIANSLLIRQKSNAFWWFLKHQINLPKISLNFWPFSMILNFSKTVVPQFLTNVLFGSFFRRFLGHFFGQFLDHFWTKIWTIFCIIFSPNFDFLTKFFSRYTRPARAIFSALLSVSKKVEKRGQKKI